MTENEKIIEEANEIAKGRMYATNEVIRLQKELEQYRAIGTVEECIDAVMNIERFCMIGRNKGIDEFAERLKDKAEEMLKNPDIIAECKKCIIWTIKNIDDIAEQLKGE